ncbi:hypothetical protein GWI34_13915 [Actinomadura sp. DSM 109109]|nr:hypothetical protein [Actinomadura lepetitiana]
MVDYDALAAALTAGAADTHRHPRPVQRVAHRARRAAVREARKQAQGHEV